MEVSVGFMLVSHECTVNLRPFTSAQDSDRCLFHSQFELILICIAFTGAVKWYERCGSKQT